MSIRIKLIDYIRHTDILGKYEDLQKIYSDHALSEKIKNENLLNLLLSAKNNRFYKNYLKKFLPSDIEANPYEILKSLPIIDKDIINKNYDLFYTPIEGRETQLKKTGGSTGNPFYYHVDKEHLSWFWAHIYYFWNLHSGFVPGNPFVTIAGNSLRTVKRKSIENVYHTLQNNYFIKGDVIKASIKLNKRKLKKAILLYGYPSSISSILKVVPDLPQFTKNLKAIFTTSEQLTPQMRRLIEESFKIPVFDMYGANDGGILTCECVKHNGYHLNDINCVVESYINEFGMSELLLTNLSSNSFPFIKYRVGDLGSVDMSQCECGLKSPRVVDLKGRTRDLIYLPDGNKVHGSFFNSLFYKYPVIDGYKIIQEDNYSITLHLHLKDDIYSDQLFRELSNSLISEVRNVFKSIDISTIRMVDNNVSLAKFKLIESHVHQTL